MLEMFQSSIQWLNCNQDFYKKKNAKEGEEKDILSEHLSLAVTLTYIWWIITSILFTYLKGISLWMILAYDLYFNIYKCSALDTKEWMLNDYLC
jgi:hypothetical protein